MPKLVYDIGSWQDRLIALHRQHVLKSIFQDRTIFIPDQGIKPEVDPMNICDFKGKLYEAGTLNLNEAGVTANRR